MSDYRKNLFSLLKAQAYRPGRVVLSSGKVSDYYLDARRVTLSAEGAYLTATIILRMIKGQDIRAIGGPTLGADPIVGGIAALSFLNKSPVDTFLVRKAAKGYGMKQRVEGAGLDRGDRVIIVDDVATSGASLVDCVRLFRDRGVIVKQAIVLVDRQEGAKQALAELGCPLEAIFSGDDFR
ncbi:MAG: orotate phosphoribosyltransferase [Candidatus Omnitrophota bacterium]